MKAVQRKRLVILGVVALLLVPVLGFIGVKYFAPQATQNVDAPEVARWNGKRPLAQGTFSAADSTHQVSGSVRLFKQDQGQVLVFKDYQATSGPDVFFYVSPAHDRFDPAAAKRILVPEGVGTGQATLRGNYLVQVPADVDATRFVRLVVWCERFGVVFGSAPLAPPK